MKTRVLLAATLLVSLAVSAQAGVLNTKHDLSSGGGQTIKGTTNQVCVFCHAPHNATSNKLLWNRNSIGDGTNMKVYTSYNSSAMRTALISRTALDSTSNSLLCLSCHSLTTAAAVITNTAFNQGGTDASGASTTFPSKTGGMTNLTNDHPVGINYAAAQSADTAGFPAAASNKVGVLRLFNSSQGADTMECASCHNVHDNSNTKFLAMNNTQSNLCVACHINK